MQIRQVLVQLREQRDRIQAAITALTGLADPSTGGTATSIDGRRKRKPLSAEARRKIGDAQRKRWAARKKAA